MLNTKIYIMLNIESILFFSGLYLLFKCPLWFIPRHLPGFVYICINSECISQQIIDINQIFMTTICKLLNIILSSGTKHVYSPKRMLFENSKCLIPLKPPISITMRFIIFSIQKPLYIYKNLLILAKKLIYI